MTLFGMSAATFSTIPHDLHRRRRAALNPFFSKAVVARFEPQLRTLNDRLCQRLREFKETGEPANLGVIFAALSTDVITTYAFGEAYNSLNAPDFNPQLYKAVQANTRNTPVAKQFPWIIPLSRKLPYWAVKAMNPLLMQMVYFAEVRLSADGLTDLSYILTTLGSIFKLRYRIPSTTLRMKESAHPRLPPSFTVSWLATCLLVRKVYHGLSTKASLSSALVSCQLQTLSASRLSISLTALTLKVV